MQSQNITEELHEILSNICAEGKEPSVALVKSRLSITVPMPTIIHAIRSWRTSNKVPNIEVSTPSTSVSNEQRIAELEQQIQILTTRLDALEKKSTL